MLVPFRFYRILMASLDFVCNVQINDADVYVNEIWL